MSPSSHPSCLTSLEPSVPPVLSLCGKWGHECEAGRLPFIRVPPATHSSGRLPLPDITAEKHIWPAPYPFPQNLYSWPPWPLPCPENLSPWPTLSSVLHHMLLYKPVDTLACMSKTIYTLLQTALRPRKAHTHTAHPLEHRHRKTPKQPLNVSMAPFEEGNAGF